MDADATDPSAIGNATAALAADRLGAGARPAAVAASRAHKYAVPVHRACAVQSGAADGANIVPGLSASC